ncbi:MAG: hypothetical protein ACKOZL_04650, partial [Actinomycetes bacterium]
GDGRFCTGCGAPRPVESAPTVSAPTAAGQMVPIPATGTQFTMASGLAAVAAGMLALLALFLPNSYYRLFGFWNGFELFSISTALIVGLIAAGVCSLALGPRHPHWSIGCVAACATFVGLLLGIHLAAVGYAGAFRSPAAGGAVAFLAAACSVAAAAFAVMANVRAGTLKIAVDPRFAAIGFAAAAALGLWILADVFDGYGLWGKAGIVVWTVAFAGSVVIGTLVGVRASIATSGVALVVLAFYLLGFVTDGPDASDPARVALALISAGLLIALVVRCITLLQTEAPRRA